MMRYNIRSSLHLYTRKSNRTANSAVSVCTSFVMDVRQMIGENENTETVKSGIILLSVMRLANE